MCKQIRARTELAQLPLLRTVLAPLTQRLLIIDTVYLCHSFQLFTEYVLVWETALRFRALGVYLENESKISLRNLRIIICSMLHPREGVEGSSRTVENRWSPKAN